MRISDWSSDVCSSDLDRHGAAERGACRGCAHRDRHVGFDQHDLALDPPAASLDLAGIGLRMEAPLAALRELEMLDRVGDVDLAAFDSGLVERAIEHPPRRADEGATGQILLIAR